MGKKKKGASEKPEPSGDLDALRTDLDAVIARVAALEIASAARPAPRPRPTRAARVAPPPPASE
jgi:hypothetical protein